MDTQALVDYFVSHRVGIMRNRKNWATLTDAEKGQFVVGLKALKKSGIYDTFVDLHWKAMVAVHNGPAFLPWHRRFIFEFELQMSNALNQRDFALPYWDWTNDSLIAPGSAPVFDARFLGGIDGGPGFDKNKWPIHPAGAISGSQLVRRIGIFGTTQTPFPFNKQLVDSVLEDAPYTVFARRLENELHDRLHAWTAGQTPEQQKQKPDEPHGHLAYSYSPIDPLFFLHHCFVDKLWAQWQWRNIVADNSYAADANAPPGHQKGQPLLSGPGVAWATGLIVDGAGQKHPFRPNDDDWDFHEVLIYRYDDEFSWHVPVFLKPAKAPPAQGFPPDPYVVAARTLTIGAMTNTPLGDYVLFLARPGRNRSWNGRSICLQLVAQQNLPPLDLANYKDGMYVDMRDHDSMSVYPYDGDGLRQSFGLAAGNPPGTISLTGARSPANVCYDHARVYWDIVGDHWQLSRTFTIVIAPDPT